MCEMSIRVLIVLAVWKVLDSSAKKMTKQCQDPAEAAYGFSRPCCLNLTYSQFLYLFSGICFALLQSRIVEYKWNTFEIQLNRN